MLQKYIFKKKKLIFLILRLHVMIFSLIAVLWVRSQFKKKGIVHPPKKSQTWERKAKFIPPQSPPQKNR